MKVSKNMKSTNKNNFSMDYTPIKAPNGAPKNQPKGTVTKANTDMRTKAGK